MSRPGNVDQRAAVRRGWGHDDPSVLACFIIGVMLKRTPVNPWAPEKKKLRDAQQGGGPPRGQLSMLPQLAALQKERAELGDLLLLNNSVEIDSGGTSGLKTLPWWQHAVTMLPNAKWFGKADDDTLLNVPTLFDRLPASPPPYALLGTIKWACYSNKRFKHERSAFGAPCGTSKFARSRHPGEPENLASTYEGPYAFAYGWFYALPRALTARLADCPYAASFHANALGATAEPFFRKEDDPMNGHWLHKCLETTGEVVEPLPTLAPKFASNMACISSRGLYRRPHNESVIVHFLKSPTAMEYVNAVLRKPQTVPLPQQQRCCSRMVWPEAAHRHPASVCDGVL